MTESRPEGQPPGTANVRRTTPAGSRAGEQPDPLGKRLGKEGETEPPTGIEGIDPENLPPGAHITETEAGTELRFSSTEAENAKVERKRQAGLDAQRQARIDQIQTPPPVEPTDPEAPIDAARDRD